LKKRGTPGVEHPSGKKGTYPGTPRGVGAVGKNHRLTKKCCGPRVSSKKNHKGAGKGGSQHDKKGKGEWVGTFGGEAP